MIAGGRLVRVMEGNTCGDAATHVFGGLVITSGDFSSLGIAAGDEFRTNPVP